MGATSAHVGPSGGSRVWTRQDAGVLPKKSSNLAVATAGDPNGFNAELD